MNKLHINNYRIVVFIVVFFIVLPLSKSADSSNQEKEYSLDLTLQEKKWLQDNSEISFTGDPNWLPYEAFTPQGNYVGIVAAHLDIISQLTGLTFKINPSQTWTESTEKAKKGIVDVLSETDDSDLKSHLNFTQSYLSNPIVIVMSINENYVEKISRIAHKRIALIKDYGYASKIRRKYSTINFKTVDNIQDGLLAVSTNKVDALFCTLALCSYTMHELGLNNVKIIGKTEFDTKLALGVQKNKPELLSILNKAIQSITQGQQQLILDEWITHKFVEKIDYTIAYIVTIVALILIIAFYFWNRRLSKEISLRHQVEQKLKISSDSNERYRVLFFESSVGHAVNSLATGAFISVNQSFAQITGYSLDELNQISYWDLTPKRYEALEQKQLESLNTTGRYGPYEKHYIQKNGSQVAVRLNGSIITDPKGEKLILSVVEDISAFSEAKEKLRLSSLVVENSSEAMLVTDENNHIIAANPAFTTITGYQLDEIKGQNPSIFKSGKHDQSFYQDLWGKLNTQGRWQGEIWDKRKNGEIYAKWLTIDTIKEPDDSISRYVALFSDITSKKASEKIIWTQANFDSLTGLPNRHRFLVRLEEEINQANQNSTSFALLLIDLDKFKEVNDTLGHDIGDLLLKIASKRIINCVRESDTVARLGGDEFTVILSNISELEDINRITENIISLLAQSYQLNDEVVHISASIGITMYPQDANSKEALIKNADQAMYAAKNQGRNQFSHFSSFLKPK